MNRLIPDTIATRTLLVLVVGLTVSHLASVALYSNDRMIALRMTGGAHIAERIATVTEIVDNAPEDRRAQIVEIADGAGLRVTRALEPAVSDERHDRWQTDLFRAAFTSHLPAGVARDVRLRLSEPDQAGAPHAAHPDLFVAIRLSDGSWLNFTAQLLTIEPLWSFRSILSMTVMLIAVIVLSAVVVRKMTRPIATFAQAAERLGTNVNAPPLAERGPAEVRQAARIFNEMQERIRRFVEDRTQMLAAISHDLGTPITRLRLRAEFVEDAEQRRKMLADLEAMEKMVASALAFARDDTIREPHVMVDLNSLLQRVCDDIADAGHEVTLDAATRAVRYGCRPAALRRALTNLVENAVKYGQRARLSLGEDRDAVRVTVDDDGPGIPDDLKEAAFRPFQRLEASRSGETGGTGLGLAIARTIIRAHGGDVALINRDGGGLRVEVALPK